MKNKTLPIVIFFIFMIGFSSCDFFKSKDEICETGTGLKLCISRNHTEFIIELEATKITYGMGEGAYVMFVPEINFNRAIQLYGATNKSIELIASGTYANPPNKNLNNLKLISLSIDLFSFATQGSIEGALLLGSKELTEVITGIKPIANASQLPEFAMAVGNRYINTVGEINEKSHSFMKLLGHLSADQESGIHLTYGKKYKIKLKTESPKSMGIRVTIPYIRSDPYPIGPSFQQKLIAKLFGHEKNNDPKEIVYSEVISAYLPPLDEDNKEENVIKKQGISKESKNNSIKLKKASILSGRVELLLPKDYKKYSAEEKSSFGDELFFYINEQSSLYITAQIEIPIQPPDDIYVPEMSDTEVFNSYKNILLSMLKFFDIKNLLRDEVVNINNTTFGILEASYEIASQKIYHFVAYTILEEKKYFQFQFVCDSMKNLNKWRPIAQRIVNSIKIKGVQNKYNKGFITPDLLGKNIVQSLRDGDISHFMKFVVNKKDLETLMDLVNEEGKDEISDCISDLPEFRNHARKTFFDCINEGNEIGINWKLIKFKSSKYNIEFESGLELSDILIIFSYNNIDYHIELIECCKMKRGWLIVAEGIKLREK